MIGNKRNFASALVVPNFEVLEAWAKANGIPAASRDELVRRPEVVGHYQALVNELTPDLAQFEKIKKIALLHARVLAGGGRAHAHAQGEAPRGRGALQAADRRDVRRVTQRLARGLFLASLFLLPWGALLPLAALHEHAQWSDAVFALATAAWAASLALERRLPRLRLVHAALALYVGWACLSWLAAAPRAGSGPAKLARPRDAGRPVRAHLGHDAAAGDAGGDRAHRSPRRPCSAAAAAVAGVALALAGRTTPLVGPCGDLLPGPLSRAQAGFPHPNLLASFCVFASAAVAREDAGCCRGPCGSRSRRRSAWPCCSPRRARSSPSRSRPRSVTRRRRAERSSSGSRRWRSSSRWPGSPPTTSCWTRRVPGRPASSTRRRRGGSRSRAPLDTLGRAPALRERARQPARPARPRAVRRAPHAVERRGDARAAGPGGARPARRRAVAAARAAHGPRELGPARRAGA